ncbi:MAG: hypothetical protein Q7S96_03820 [bacterium]|nr:hypothetical protein [bacterium]
MAQEPQPCRKCSQAKGAVGHDVTCWFAFQVELIQLRPKVAAVVDDVRAPLYLGDDLRGIFDAWTDRIRATHPRHFGALDQLVATRIARALGFIDQQVERHRASRPKLVIVSNATRAA